uniref:Dienelactone hydrolase domain-containing protein n=1 Tax=Setaria italica TaxID=4555 RepID=K3Z8J5_SETIT
MEKPTRSRHSLYVSPIYTIPRPLFPSRPFCCAHLCLSPPPYSDREDRERNGELSVLREPAGAGPGRRGGEGRGQLRRAQGVRRRRRGLQGRRRPHRRRLRVRSAESEIADKVALSGYFVVVPDFFHGDAYIPENEKPIHEWLKSHAPEKGFEDAKPVIAALKEQGVSAIGAAGYCWGAKVVVELSKAQEIQAAVLLHPSFVSVDDMKEVKCPISILGAEVDKMSPPELVKQFEQVLSAKSGVGHFVKVFPGVSHGWSVRYSHDDAAAVKSAEEALADMIDWFNKNLK